MISSHWLHSNQLNISRVKNISVKYLMPNWQGECLESKDFAMIREAIKPLLIDIKQQLQRDNTLNTSLRKQIYDHYIDSIPNEDNNIDLVNFWLQVFNTKACSLPVSLFVKEFVHKIAMIFILKQKLLIKHAQTTSFRLYPAYYSNLNSLYSKLFTTEIANDSQFKSFKTNIFSWYDPSAYLIHQSQDISSIMSLVSPQCFLNYIQRSFYQFSISSMANLLMSLVPSQTLINIDESSSQQEYIELIQECSATQLVQSNSKISHEFLNIISELYFCLSQQSKTILNHKDYLQKVKLALMSDSTIYLSQDHYFLINNSISSAVLKSLRQLKGSVYIIQLSKAQIFQPGLKNKNHKLLQDFKIIDHIQIEATISKHIYRYKDKNIESKEHSSESSHPFYKISSHNQGFRLADISANLKSIKEILLQKSTMVFSKQFNDFTIDYFQDDLVNGVLLSSSQDPDNITHPRFFQALTNRCIPLQKLFKTSPLKSPERISSRSETVNDLPLIDASIILPPYVLVIKKQYAKQYESEVDIIPGDSYLGYLKDHGSFENQFFALIPKVPELNMSILRRFFKSQIGKQIIQLCFRGNSHFRTKIKTLLIPRLIGSLHSASSFEKSLFSEINNLDFKTASPNKLIENFEEITNNIGHNFLSHPLSTIEDICFFQDKIQSFLINQKSQNAYHIDFYQSQLISELKALNTSALLPKHEDVFIDITVKKEQLNLTFTQLNAYIADEEHENYRLELLHLDQSLVTLYTKKYLFEFIKFLLSNMQGLELSQILRSLNLPRERDLKVIIPSYEIDNSVFYEILKKCDIVVQSLFKQYIMHKEIND